MTTSDVKGRFRDNDELKFLLRSIEKNVKEYKRIVLITDNQIPRLLYVFSNTNIYVLFFGKVYHSFYNIIVCFSYCCIIQKK
jgi:hypothetical protein